ncbi:2,3-diketo-5-methylthio-1-phosphopentane phosphatase [Lipomyces japonicus]|uniref:2,3-diketo-5-methylthio-1-phosphopentane phosphatase n=1 Tax=Lipomyces japonicus TaxID=56871 RepID=UPI0034CFC8D8
MSSSLNNSTASSVTHHPTRSDVAIFSDFDGTIFMQDTGHVLFDKHGCGAKHREHLDHQINTGTRSFRDASEEMWGSLTVTFDDSMEDMKNHLEIDADFEEFHDFCIQEGVPFNVISAGLKPVLRGVLDQFLGEDASNRIGIISNDAEISPDGTKWIPIWRHDNELGHDKSVSIKECRAQLRKQLPQNKSPLIIFVGDGVSDLPAAREADVLFARHGLRLEEYCIEHSIDFIPFDTFADVQHEVSRILDSGDLERFKKPANRSATSSSTIASSKHKLFGNVDTRKSRRTDKTHLSPISSHFGKTITIA